MPKSTCILTMKRYLFSQRVVWKRLRDELPRSRRHLAECSVIHCGRNWCIVNQMDTMWIMALPIEDIEPMPPPRNADHTIQIAMRRIPWQNTDRRLGMEVIEA